MKKKVLNDHEKYLKNLKQKRITILITQIGIVVLFVAVWQILADTGKIDSFITSKPSEIVKTFFKMLPDGLMRHVWVTCYETIVGFALGSIIGIVFASFLWWSEFLSRVFSPFLIVLNSLPKVALGPIIIIWVGAGTPAIIVMALAISLVVTIMEVLSGFESVNPNLIKMAKTFGATRWQVFTKVVLPANVPTIIDAMKVNIGLSMVGVITGEFLVSKAGLGHLIVYGGQVFRLDLVMTSVIILGVVATLMYGVVCLIEKIICGSKKWL